MKTKNKWIIITLIIGSVLLTSCNSDVDLDNEEPPLNAVVPGTVIAEGMIVPAKEASLSFVQGGRVDSVFVDVGDWVEEGEELISLTNKSQIKAELKAVELQLLNAEQALADLDQNESLDRESIRASLLDAQLRFNEAEEEYEDLDEDAYQEDLEEAEADVIEASQDIEEAQSDLEEYLELDEDNATRKRYEDALEDAQDVYNRELRQKTELIDEYDRVVNEYLLAEANLNIYTAEYEKRSDGPDTDQLETLEAQIDSLESRKDALLDQLEDATIIAPFSGKVMEINLDESEFAAPGQPVVFLADTSNWYVESNDLTELEVVKVSRGQDVEILVEAYPDSKLNGKVDRIGDFPNMEFGDVLYQVDVLVDETATINLKWGMSVTLTFLGE